MECLCNFRTHNGSLCLLLTVMATSSSVQVPRVLHFQLVDGMQLQVFEFPFSRDLITMVGFSSKVIVLPFSFFRLMSLDVQVDAMLELNFSLKTAKKLGFFTGVLFTMGIRKARTENLS